MDTQDAQSKIGDLVRRLESDYTSGTTTVSKYVSFNMAEKINKIEAYANSKHTSGETDSQGRDKPFFNICTASENIWYRATDIDRSQIFFKASKYSQVIPAFFANVLLGDWMTKASFGLFLNEWGRCLARYGSSIPKFVEKDNDLFCSVNPWNRMIVDAVDFDGNAKIEILDLTEAQLRKKVKEGYDKEIVDQLCKAARQARKNADGTIKDNKNDYIRVYEVHGELPLSWLTENEEDDDIYVQQMHAISYVAAKEDGKFNDFTLVSGKEDKEPNFITHLIKEDGQTISKGAIEHLFDPQWMMNHSIKAAKDQLDLASKLIFQTSDTTFIGQNALSNIENGDILIHAKGEPLTQLQNNSHDITSLQSFANQWKALANEITGISESMMGNTAPAGTAWRQIEALLQENHSLFELMTENKGLYLEQMLRKYVCPFIRKQLKNKDEITAILQDHDIEWIDSRFVSNQAITAVNKAIVDKVINDEEITPDMQQGMMLAAQAGIKDMLSSTRNQRFFKPDDIDDQTWQDILNDFDWNSIMVDVTGEQVNKDALTTLNTMLASIARNPAILQDPNVKMIWNKILMLTGTVSPIEMARPSSSPQPQPLANNATGR